VVLLQWPGIPLQHLGGAYRLPNGNTFAVLGTTGMVCEITPARQVVWVFNLGGQAGRASKYARDFAVGCEEEVPDSRAPIMSCTPNPSERSSTLRYTLARAGHVTLSVFDATGRLVETPVDEEQVPGSYEATLTNAGRARGVCLARLLVVDSSGTRAAEPAKLVWAR